ncbi:MAG: SusC/RagA family TonB-linked outer membrane protein [Bacteroidales bacterium]
MQRTITTLFLLAIVFLVQHLSLESAVQAQTVQEDEPRSYTFFQDKEILRSPNPTFSIKLQQVSLEEALAKIAKKAKAGIYFDADLIPEKTVTFDFYQTSLYEILNKVLDGTGLEMHTTKRNIFLKEKSIDNSAFTGRGETPDIQITITGTVVDAETGGPLPGVTIVVQGTTTGTTTDTDGIFELMVPDLQQTLVISYVGYVSQTIPIDGRTQWDIELATEVTGLDELVVTAFGMERERRSLGYSVSEISGEDLTVAREVNLGDALVGKIAGVNATSTATGPGGSSRVIIRGNSSLGGTNQPLYVVNGVPVDNSNYGQAAGTWGGVDRGDGLNSFNPGDIESISVLKGGAASALYGSRASNGVILITTKSGRGRSGFGVDFNSQYTAENIFVVPDWQYEYGSGTRGNKPTNQAQAIENGRNSWGAPLDGSMVVQPDGEERPYVAQRDNFKNFYETGQKLTNSIGISGGTESVSYRFSVSDLNIQGIVPNSTVRRNTFNLNTTADISGKIRVEGNAQYNIEEGKGRAHMNDFPKNPNGSAYLLASSIDIRTLAPGYDERGYESEWNDYEFVTNPYFAVNKVISEDERRRFIGSLHTRYNISDYLYLSGRIGIDYTNYKDKSVTPTGIKYQPEGSMSESFNTRYETNIEGILGLENDFGNYSLNILAGGNQMSRKLEGTNVSSGRLNVPFTYFIRNGLNPNFSQPFREEAINSLFGSAEIGYNQYLYLTATGRQEWFSTLAKDSNTLFYPSVALGFVFSDALRTPDWLTNGQIRASWAEVGGGAPSAYALNQTYSPLSNSHLGQAMMTISGNNVPNEELQPYKTTTYELGIEIGFLDNRLRTDLAFYDQTTTNDIVSSTIPTSSGYTSVLVNVGELQNRGIELLLSATLAESPTGLNWETSFNMTYNVNKVVKISDEVDNLSVGSPTRTVNGWIYHFEGKPFGMIAGYKAKRDESGNVIYDRTSGTPVQSELQILGKGVPPLLMGIQNSLFFGNFSMSFLIDGKFGGSLYSGTNDHAYYWGKHQNTVQNNIREEGITLTGVDRDGEPFNRTVSAQDYYQSIAFSITDEFVYNSDFIKFRELSVGYSLPQSLVNRAGAQSAKLSLVGRNLLLLYSGVPNIDPESTYHTGNAQGLEMFAIPPTRSIGLNLNLSF